MQDRSPVDFLFSLPRIRCTCSAMLYDLERPAANILQFALGLKSKMMRSVVIHWLLGHAFGLTDFVRVTGLSIFSIAPEKRQGEFYWFVSRRRRLEQTTYDASFLQGILAEQNIFFLYLVHIQGFRCICFKVQIP